MNALLLLLLDSRAPAGAHHHSAGMEAAIMAGLVTDLAGTEDFCQTRLRTSARVAASFAAASCRLFSAERHGLDLSAERSGLDPSLPAELAVLDAEYEARVPSEATRRASRELGRGLGRLLRSVLASLDLAETDLGTAFSRCAGPAPHHPLVLGAGVALAGGDPELAGRAAALGACAGPASAALRLLGLDPFAVHAMLARLAPGVDECAAFAAGCAGWPPSALPAHGAPALDLLADYHLTAEVRLFAS
ncbi:MAG TPA: urease accessory UreF family protein [Streptosporangiaceae bacterium]|jgi:urease accessory protein